MTSAKIRAGELHTWPPSDTILTVRVRPTSLGLHGASLLLITALAGSATAAPTPVFFQENQGQWPEEVRLGAIGPNAVTFLGARGPLVHFASGRVLRFEAAAAAEGVVGEGPLPGYVNHFIGQDPRRWRRRVPIYSGARARGLAPGVDLRMRELHGEVELLLVVAPGADPSKLRLRVRGHERMELRPDGSLVVQAGGDRMTWSRPVAYQERNGLRAEVPVKFVVQGSSLRFEVGPHDPEAALIIDPILTYAAQVAGTGNLWGVAATPDGRAQLAGDQSTAFGTFPATPGSYQPNAPGNGDMAILRVDPSLSGPASLIWATYLGGADGPDAVVDVAVGPTGDVAVVGPPSGTFPMVNPVDNTRFGSDGVVAVLSADGTQLRFSTYLSYHPGAPQLFVQRVAMDARGYAYVAGRIDGNWTLENAVLPTQSNGGYRAFFTVYDPVNAVELNGMYLTEHTGAVEGLAADSAGNLVAAFSSTPNVYVTPGTVGPMGDHIAVVKWGPIGDAANPAQLIWSTALGGTGVDQVEGLAVDAADNVYVSGLTPAQDFGTTSGAYRTTLPAGNADFFVTKLNPDATTKLYSTYLGFASSGAIRTDDLAVDRNGRAYLISGGGPFTPTACGTSIGPVLTVLSADGSSREFATALGNGAPIPLSVAVLPNGSALISGTAGVIPNVNAFSNSTTGGGFMTVPTPTTCTDLAIAASGPNTGATGLNLTYPVTVTNLVADANNVRITIDASLSATFVSISQGACTGTGPWVCDLGHLAVGGSLALQVTLRPTVVGTLTTLFNVASDTYDTNPVNDTSSVVSVISAGTSPCGSVTYAGECLGRVLRYCEDEGTAAARLVTVNCATDLYPPGVIGDCTLIDPVYGHDCTAAPGNACAFADGQGGTYVSFCRGDRPGCVYEDGGDLQAICAEQIGPCTPPAPGQAFVPVCTGSVLVRGCQVNQPVGFDCASLGGRCANATCVELPAGSRCDGAELLCATGLTCDPVSETCVDPNTLCDPRSFTPTCRGAILERCDPGDGVKVEVDCAARGREATCGPTYSCSDDGSGRCASLNLGCVTPAGSDTCDLLGQIYCGVGRSCFVTFDASRGSSGRCGQAATSCGPGQLHVGCLGNVASFCLGNQGAVVTEPAGFDCESFGGACGLEPSRGDPVCYGREGARCRDPVTDPNTPFRCEPGQRCSGGETNFGRCEPDPNTNPDAGVQGDSGVGVPDSGVGIDAGTEPPPPTSTEEGCGCQATDPVTGERPWLVLGFLALAWVGRSRRGAPARSPH